ncbi:pyridoxamine 5'-phosphate oxidase family protein [Roseibium sp. SCPC15]|uniref:FAD-binding oxidoreductase n=1 Tax=Roseibium sp. SCP15 TaxID=3141376 RepID=UPI00333CCF42
MVESVFRIADDDQLSPFHEGERQIQKRMGAEEIETWARKVIRDYMPAQHREFYEAQPFLIVSARDEKGRPWATVLEGNDGFVTSPEPDRLTITSVPVKGDALEAAFVEKADVGILGIELETRRRNRVNGRIEDKSDNSISFAVDQSFGNCPQYIRERKYWRNAAKPAIRVFRGHALTAFQKDWIGAADTFFIASGYRGEGDTLAYGMDVSHRGGERGFVEVLDERRIRFPDYAGNNHYNTLGNLALDPRAGFLFLDFSTGSLLQLTGKASIDWNSDIVSRVPGARQLVTLEIEEIVELASALELRWQEDADSARTLRLMEKRQESADVMSLLFEARDGGDLPVFEAGQHLPIELNIPGQIGKVDRTYSLSGSPLDNRYRISVKREKGGLASTFLHDGLQVGSIVESRKPSGDFMMTCAECPLVLVSAGIGVTPMLSILHKVSREQGDRSVWFVHGARDGNHHPFRDEIKKLADNRSNIELLTLYSRPLASDIQGRDFDEEGRVSAELISQLVDRADAHYFICGPAAFMVGVKADLEDLGVPETQIHYETF